MESATQISLPAGTLTFLFTDIEGSTRLLSSLGEPYRDLLERHAAIMRAAIAAHGGTEIGTEGDSFFAVFPSAAEAVRAAADSQQELAGADWPGGESVRVRMGLHTGEGRLGGDNYVGLDVHRAARIAGAGHGGQVLVSETTRALVASSLSGGIGLRDLGEHRFKDFDVPMRIWELTLPGLPSDFPPIRSLGAPGGSLPLRLTSFVGRERELADVLHLVEAHRLVTVTGPGGTGKTRLALEVAGAVSLRLAGGAYFADLSAIRQPDLVPLQLAEALRATVDPGGDALFAVRAWLRERELFLVMDNFEQVADAAGTVDELLAAAPGLRVLATSRRPLGIEGEREYAVPPLAIPPRGGSAKALRRYAAVDLFVDRAQAVSAGFTLTDESAEAVAGIVRHLDGLPLAIELAASQVRVLPPTTILDRLEQHRPLAAPDAGRPARQRTMAAAIGWSYELLAHAERRLFARLSVFPGGASLEAAEAVGDEGDGGPSVLDSLAVLLSHSLLRRQRSDVAEPRFDMLEPIREYARERLATDFDDDATHRRLAQFVASFAEEAEPHLMRIEQIPWLDRCEEERPNVRRAIEWAIEAGEAELALRIGASLWRFWQQRGPMWEGRRLLVAALALPGASPAASARGHGAAGGLAWWGDDLPATQHHYDEALRLARESGDERVLMTALLNAGFATIARGPEAYAEADALYRSSFAIAERLGDRAAGARANQALGFAAALFKRDYATALPIFEESVRVFDELGERSDLADALVSLGNVLRRIGEVDRGRGYYLRGLDMAIEAGHRPMSTGLLVLLAALEGDAGEHVRAMRLWSAAESLHQAAGAVRPAVAHRLIGDPVAAARAAIGDEAVDRALGEGRTMSYEAAMAYAHGQEAGV